MVYFPIIWLNNSQSYCSGSVIAIAYYSFCMFSVVLRSSLYILDALSTEETSKIGFVISSWSSLTFTEHVSRLLWKHKSILYPKSFPSSHHLPSIPYPSWHLVSYAIPYNWNTKRDSLLKIISCTHIQPHSLIFVELRVSEKLPTPYSRRSALHVHQEHIEEHSIAKLAPPSKTASQVTIWA